MTLAGAILLAGGTGSRLGGVDKPGLDVDGRALIERALTAVGDVPVVVVGPPRPVGRGVLTALEEPPGSGPAAALAAGIDVLAAAGARGWIAVLATDLPAVSASTLDRLLAALAGNSDVAGPAHDGAVLVDADGRQQLLLGVWRWSALVSARGARPSWAQASIRSMLAPLSRVAVPAVGDEAADIDTPDELARWRRPT